MVPRYNPKKLDYSLDEESFQIFGTEYEDNTENDISKEPNSEEFPNIEMEVDSSITNDDTIDYEEEYGFNSNDFETKDSFNAVEIKKETFETNPEEENYECDQIETNHSHLEGEKRVKIKKEIYEEKDPLNVSSERTLSNRVSVQGVKSLGGHFACLCRGFEFYEVKKIKNCYYF
jgi:hypothetical protein